VALVSKKALSFSSLPLHAPVAQRIERRFPKRIGALPIPLKARCVRHLDHLRDRAKRGISRRSPPRVPPLPRHQRLQAGTKTPTSFGAPRWRIRGPSTHTKPLARARKKRSRARGTQLTARWGHSWRPGDNFEENVRVLELTARSDPPWSRDEVPARTPQPAHWAGSQPAASVGVVVRNRDRLASGLSHPLDHAV